MIDFQQKEWVDTQTSGTAITSNELNRLEQAVSKLVDRVNEIEGRKPLTLWEGTLKPGNKVTVAGISKYSLVAVGMCLSMDDNPYVNAMVPLVPFFNEDGIYYARGASGLQSGSDLRIASASLEIVNDTVSMAAGVLASVNANGTVSTLTGRNVYRIAGIA